MEILSSVWENIKIGISIREASGNKATICIVKLELKVEF